MEPILSIQNLSFQYPDGKWALDGINLSIPSGEKVAIVGANGAGKSTLLLQLNGVFTGSGLIKIDGIECTKKNLQLIRANVGVVFQNPDDQLFSVTVYDDVAYGPRYQGLPNEVIEQKVRAALAAVQLDDFATRNPYHLSGGEKKRAAIATVLSMDPKILVFDEPTAGLDPRARRELIDLLEKLPQTMVIATHDLAMVAQLTSRMVVMNGGKIVKDGEPRALLQDNKLLFANGLK